MKILKLGEYLKLYVELKEVYRVNLNIELLEKLKKKKSLNFILFASANAIVRFAINKFLRGKNY